MGKTSRVAGKSGEGAGNPFLPNENPVTISTSYLHFPKQGSSKINFLNLEGKVFGKDFW